VIRPVAIADAAQIQAIYAHHVEHGTGTFEEAAPSVEGMQRRIADVLDRGLPYLVAEEDGRIAGFAYASPFRLRSAYRYCAEDSVYVAPGRHGQGLGRTLLDELIAACEVLGLRQLIAVIGDSANAGSVGVHRACGFEMIGAAKGVGFKHGRFLDIVFMQKALNGGTEGTPDWDGLVL
jgi:L-amino acid N-acyltransferase YncA